MEFEETIWFTKWVVASMGDEEYRRFQNYLYAYPSAGDVIPGGGGLRKIRLALPGKGKRGGVRVIYFHAASRNTILLLFAYEKNKLGNLTPDQVKVLRRIVREEYP